MFAKRDKHYPSRSGQTSLATAVTDFTKPVTKINSGPSTCISKAKTLKKDLESYLLDFCIMYWEGVTREDFALLRPLV